MADVFADPPSDQAAADFGSTLDNLKTRTEALTLSSTSFAAAVTRAFTQAVAGGKQFDDVLRALALRISSLAVSGAFAPIAGGISAGLNGLFAGLFGSSNPTGLTFAAGGIKPFAAGGVIGTPTYFPLMSGGLGLAGEAGPEAIMPLARRPDGTLGVAAAGGATNVSVAISTPDVASFRRSEAYLTGQIARAVARGQRSM